VRPLSSMILGGVLALLASAPLAARAVPVEYRFSGLLTGEIGQSLPDPSVRLVDVPFRVSITADSDGAFEFGSIPGLGTAHVNLGSATWTVEGFGTATAASAQVYAIPGVGRVGFGWQGEMFPLDTTQPAGLHLAFVGGSPFATDPAYGHLAAIVPSVPLSLLTELENPPGTIPTYSTAIDLPAHGPLVLEETTSLSYEVVAVPEPATGALLAFGLLALSAGCRVRGRTK